MKKLFVCVSLLAVLSLVMGGAVSCEEEVTEPKVLRLSHPLPDFDVMVQSTIQAAENFNAAQDEYIIEVYAGGVLGGMLEVFDMVMAGGIDICDYSPDFLAEKDLVFGPQGLPFIFEDAQACIKFFDLITEELWADKFEDEYNVKLLSLCMTYPHDAWCGTSPIHTLEDWEGKVVWVAGPVEAEAITTLGASPMTLDWAEGYPAIEKGVVDGGTYGIGAAWMLAWEACTDYTDAGMFMSSGSLVMNLDTFNDMPGDIKDLLLEEFQAHQDKMNEFYADQGPAEAKAGLTAAGAEVYDLPASERARWIDATKDIRDSYFAKLDPDDAELIQELLEEAHE